MSPMDTSPTGGGQGRRGFISGAKSSVKDSREAREFRTRKGGGGGGVPPRDDHLQVNGSDWSDPDPDKEIEGQIQVNGHLGWSGSRTRDLGDKDNASTDQDVVW